MALEKFTLREHGDRWEQELWPYLCGCFPAYEILWRRYIVLLTERINPGMSFQQDRDHWIRLRDDVPGDWVTWAMHNYSAFYFFARATERVGSQGCPFPEDVFSLLDACGDNTRDFFTKTNRLIARLNGQALRLPTQKKDMYLDEEHGRRKPEVNRGCFVEIERYRNVILHCPVLGRAVDVGRELLPRSEVLDEIKHSWRRAEHLRQEQLVDSRELFDRLLHEVAEFLEHHWRRIISALDAVRDSTHFIEELSLSNCVLDVALEGNVGSTAQPLSASGTHWDFQTQPASGFSVLSKPPMKKQRR